MHAINYCSMCVFVEGICTCIKWQLDHCALLGCVKFCLYSYENSLHYNAQPHIPYCCCYLSFTFLSSSHPLLSLPSTCIVGTTITWPAMLQKACLSQQEKMVVTCWERVAVIKGNTRSLFGELHLLLLIWPSFSFTRSKNAVKQR